MDNDEKVGILEQEDNRSPEEAPAEPDMKADYVRHGKPSYSTEELTSANLEGTLTQDGENQAKRTAIELAAKIDKENELVVFWVSPKRRAQQTAEIIYNFFQEQNIPIAHAPKTVESLSDVKTSPAFWNGVIKDSSIPKWMEYWSENEVPEGTEKPEDLSKRSGRVIANLSRVARSVTPSDGKKLHFICVGHEEGFRDLLEEGFGVGTAEGTGPAYAEVLSMDIFTDKEENHDNLNLTFHGSKAKIKYDRAARTMSKVPDAKI